MGCDILASLCSKSDTATASSTDNDGVDTGSRRSLDYDGSVSLSPDNDGSVSSSGSGSSSSSSSVEGTGDSATLSDREIVDGRGGVEGTAGPGTSLQLFTGDMLSVPPSTLAEATVVLLVATCFPPPLVDAVCDMLGASISFGTTVITVRPTCYYVVCISTCYYVVCLEPKLLLRCSP
jgi:hypothetical protein